MTDHDQRFKVLLQEFFREFFELFFPEWAALFDFTGVEWIREEVFTDPPTGQRRFLDLIAKLPLLHPLPGQRPDEPAAMLALVHVEIEHEDTVRPLRSRMWQYYEQLRRQYTLPVLPIAVYLNVGLNGLGVDTYEEYFGEFRTVLFQYLYVGLPALNAQDYVGGGNWLGVALSGLMRCAPDERVRLATEALRRLVRCPENDQRRYLLCECVCAYSPLVEAQRQEVLRSLVTTTGEGGNMGEMSLLEYIKQQVREEVRQQVREETVRRLLQIQLEEKFGPLAPDVVERVNGLPDEELDQLFRAAVRAESLEQLGLKNGAGGGA